MSFTREPQVTLDVGSLTPEEAAAGLRSQEQLRIDRQPSHAYYRGPDNERSSAPTAEKLFEYKGEGRRGPQATLVAEQIAGRWYGTAFLACASAVPVREMG